MSAGARCCGTGRETRFRNRARPRDARPRGRPIAICGFGSGEHCEREREAFSYLVRIPVSVDRHLAGLRRHIRRASAERHQPGCGRRHSLVCRDSRRSHVDDVGSIHPKNPRDIRNIVHPAMHRADGICCLPLCQPCAWRPCDGVCGAGKSGGLCGAGARRLVAWRHDLGRGDRDMPEATRRIPASAGMTCGRGCPPRSWRASPGQPALPPCRYSGNFQRPDPSVKAAS